MTSSRPKVWLWTIALVAWSVFVWGNRLNNLRTDDSSDTERLASLGMSALSLGLAAAALVFVVQAWRGGWSLPTATQRTVLRVFAGWTMGVWLVRGVGIALDGRSVPFVVVHLVLAVVSIAIAARLWRCTDEVAAEPRGEFAPK